MRILAAFPHLPSTWQTVQLAGTSYRIRLDWRERTGSWWLSITTLEGVELAMGKRVTPDWSPIRRLARDSGIGGLLWAADDAGPRSLFARLELGDTVRICFATLNELAQLAGDDGADELVVT